MVSNQHNIMYIYFYCAPIYCLHKILWIGIAEKPPIAMPKDSAIVSIPNENLSWLAGNSLIKR